MKKYELEEKLKEPGMFKSTDHRNAFLYAWLDTAKYELRVQKLRQTNKRYCEARIRKVWTSRAREESVPFENEVLRGTRKFESAKEGRGIRSSVGKEISDEGMV